MQLIKTLCLLNIILFSFSSFAQIYKCTDSSGKVTYQDTICSAGNEEQFSDKIKNKGGKANSTQSKSASKYSAKTKAAFERAVRGNFLARVKGLLEQGVSASIVFDEGRNAHWRSSPLLIASRQGDTSMVVTLLQAGADVNYADATGETALLAAVKKDNAQLVELLIQASSNVHHVDNAQRPIIFHAVAYQRLKSLPLLLSAGANLHKKMTADDSDGPYTVAEYFTKVKPTSKLVLVTLGLIKD